MTLNNEKIAEIMQRSATAEAFATYAACRVRHARDGVSKLPTLRAQMLAEGFTPVPQDLLKMFRELEQAGVGKLQGDLFKWSVPIQHVGITPDKAAVEKAPKAVKPAPEAPKAQKSLVIFFDKERSISVQFPSLTKEEVEFVAKKLLEECTS